MSHQIRIGLPSGSDTQRGVTLSLVLALPAEPPPHSQLRLFYAVPVQSMVVGQQVARYLWLVKCGVNDKISVSQTRDPGKQTLREFWLDADSGCHDAALQPAAETNCSGQRAGQ